ncbi:1-acyl-sn-glycerol-3-phosphate acyltransferase [Algicella marina]|uniref:1-acyl-sn-glycerol-3-phosphate acyltransferase n=2 Tax=Algicella marina TaxID=2683284 RepID=A0A6P1T6Q7_9RHOB|nr:1-acyl-sn-glycerol-3-phosphate acyltransferase [Algicella marina]
MTLFRSILFDFLMFALVPIIGILGLPIALYSRGGTYWVMRQYARTVLFLLRVLCGLSVEVRGTPPQGNVMIAAKHQSFLDVMVLFLNVPRARFIMKQELRWVPVFGFYTMRIGSTPVSRGKKGKAVSAMTRDVESKKGEAGQLIIYPEGTRTLPGAPPAYKVGAGVIYTRLGQECCLVATNVGAFWPRRGWRRRPGVAVVEFLETIPVGLELHDFMDTMQTGIETASNRLLQETGFPVAPAD